MNQFIKMQITNMISLAKNFDKSCEIAALQDDGVKDRKEEATLKKLKKCTEKYINELEKISRQ